MPRLPKPFSRPGISISDGSPKKEWRDIAVRLVNTGDLVANIGVIESIQKTRDPYQIILKNVVGEQFVLSPFQEVKTFGIHLGERDTESSVLHTPESGIDLTQEKPRG